MNDSFGTAKRSFQHNERSFQDNERNDLLDKGMERNDCFNTTEQNDRFNTMEWNGMIVFRTEQLFYHSGTEVKQ